MNFKEFIGTQNWIFAKSYADKAPHEYCLKEKTDLKQEFVDAVKCIQKNGFTAYFWHKPNTYLYFDGYFYLRDLIVTDITRSTTWKGISRQDSVL